MIVDVRTQAAARDVATGGFRVTSRWHAAAGVAGVAGVATAFPLFSAFGCTDDRPVPDRVACFSDSDSPLDLLGPGTSVASTGRGGGVSEAKPFSGRLVLATNAPAAGRLVLQLRGAGVRR